jgi:hypothetical protein
VERRGRGEEREEAAQHVLDILTSVSDDLGELQEEQRIHGLHLNGVAIVSLCCAEISLTEGVREREGEGEGEGEGRGVEK